jgi:UDP-2-acetamido-2,6-beta-L-arabino-hexul-4-ose reductase
MQSVALSGGNGFLGWHTQCALRAKGDSVGTVAVGERFDLPSASRVVSGVDRLIHIAGVNRGTDAEVVYGNEQFAHQMVEAMRAADEPPKLVVFANSTQSLGTTPYGRAKRSAADTLRKACGELGINFIDVLLPNIFGEHGRPFYNSVVATFAHLVASGGKPNIENDKSLELLHAQDAADLLLGDIDGQRSVEDLFENRTVSGVLTEILEISEIYRAGQIPDISSKFRRDLFNTFRSFTIPQPLAFPLARHTDQRGAFVEIIRSHGGPGQSSFSTTVPGVTRGDHFHRRKVERFTVLSGQASIEMRRIGTEHVVSFDVSGDHPVAIDMPTMWAHNITNVGQSELFTSFWANELFDPAHPDTFAERV